MSQVTYCVTVEAVTMKTLKITNVLLISDS